MVPRLLRQQLRRWIQGFLDSQFPLGWNRVLCLERRLADNLSGLGMDMDALLSGLKLLLEVLKDGLVLIPRSSRESCPKCCFFSEPRIYVGLQAQRLTSATKASTQSGFPGVL